MNGDEVKVGDHIKDNDPRMTQGRVLVVNIIIGDHVLASDRYRNFRILKRRIHCDSKERKSGFTRVGAE